MNKKHIYEGHTFDEYRKKYGRRWTNAKLETVPLGREAELNSKKKYWLLKDADIPGYYEVSHNKVIFYWVFGGVALTGLIVGVILANTAANSGPKYTFTFEGVNCTMDNRSEYRQNITMSAIITPDRNCEYPMYVTVYINGQEVDDTNYVYNKNNGVFSAVMQGDITVKAKAITDFLEYTYVYDPANSDKDDHISYFYYKATSEIKVYWDYANDSQTHDTLSATSEYREICTHQYPELQEKKTYLIRAYGDLTYLTLSDYYIEHTANYFIQSISLPNSLTEIDSYCCHNLYNLEEFQFSENMHEILFPCFYQCTKLTSLYIPSQITFIDINNPYSACSNLTSIRVDKDNEYYDSRNNCNAVVAKKDVLDPYGDGIAQTKDTLVVGCQNTVIDSSITTIGEGAFYYQTNYVIETLPSNVTTIKSTSFYGTGIINLTIPHTITSIGQEAFAYCDNLLSVTFEDSNEHPSQVTCLDETFNGCPKLSTFDIPRSINNFLNVLSGCDNLRTVKCNSGTINFSSFAICTEFRDGTNNKIKTVDFTIFDDPTHLPTMDEHYYLNHGVFGNPNEQDPEFKILVKNAEMLEVFQNNSDYGLMLFAAYYQVAEQ